MADRLENPEVIKLQDMIKHLRVRIRDLERELEHTKAQVSHKVKPWDIIED